jgi:metal-responsive CopG/Arc/MetJ family transcriptional regulator
VPLTAGRLTRGGAAYETAMPNPATRFDVRMSDELAQEFDEIQRTTGLNGAEVFRRAIALYKIAKKASKEGEKVILRAEDRERELVSI